MFIDTGDIFISFEVQSKIVNTINENPDADVISFSYLYKNEILNNTSNRLHGKIYKRAFLEKYDITFAPESSYMNEDIGFNRTCRLCTDNIVYIDLPVIQWIENEESLTEKDNKVTLYRDQTRALSLVSIHTVETCRKNGVNADIEINQIAISLYYWFIRTTVERPEYIEDAWKGAKIFYDCFQEEIDHNKLLLGNPHIKQCLSYRDKVKFPINILRFAHDIQTFNNVPNQYLGGD